LKELTDVRNEVCYNIEAEFGANIPILYPEEPNFEKKEGLKD